MTHSINWEAYRDKFPIRYIGHSYFDEVLEDFIKSYGGELTALDIGGGKGTGALQSHGVRTWLLDPYVSVSDWMEGSVTWDELEQRPPCSFDIAVLRGSINYLTWKQIELIPRVCRGLIANSFERPEPGWKARKYESTLGGGIEIADSTKVHHNIITHILVDCYMNVIVHDFYAYGSKKFKSLLPDARIDKYGKSSLLIRQGILL